MARRSVSTMLDGVAVTARIPREFQAAILVGADDGRMFPLTEHGPKCLLPVLNKPILEHQLELLGTLGFEDVFVLCPPEHHAAVEEFLRHSAAAMHGGLRTELVEIEAAQTAQAAGGAVAAAATGVGGSHSATSSPLLTAASSAVAGGGVATSRSLPGSPGMVAQDSSSSNVNANASVEAVDMGVRARSTSSTEGVMPELRAAAAAGPGDGGALGELGEADLEALENAEEQMLGDADGLRQIRDRVTGDLIVLGSDAINDNLIERMANLHRRRAASLTMLLVEDTLSKNGEDVENERASGRKRRQKVDQRPARDQEDIDYLGVTEDGRIALMVPGIEVDEEGIALNKPLLHAVGTGSPLSIRSDLMDGQMYIVSRWLLDFLEENRRITSVHAELIPYLVSRQFVPPPDLLQEIPQLADSTRKREPLYNLSGILSRHAQDDQDAVTQDEAGVGDLLSCYGVIVTKQEQQHPTDGVYCERVTTIPMYSWICRAALAGRTVRHMDQHYREFRQRNNCAVHGSARIANGARRSDSTFDRDTSVGESSINSSVIMRGARIGNQCFIKNSVIGAGAVIDDEVNLDNCIVRPGGIVKKNVYRGQTLMNTEEA